MGQMTTSNEWKLLNKAHYRALRVVVRDFRGERSRKSLDEECRRATPRQWGFYTVATVAARILRNQTPNLLYELVLGNSTENSRHQGLRAFFDTSRQKIGRQALQNRLKEPFLRVTKEWYQVGLSKDTMRVQMKEAFFPYYKTKNDKMMTS